MNCDKIDNRRLWINYHFNFMDTITNPDPRKNGTHFAQLSQFHHSGLDLMPYFNVLCSHVAYGIVDPRRRHDCLRGPSRDRVLGHHGVHAPVHRPARHRAHHRAHRVFTLQGSG